MMSKNSKATLIILSLAAFVLLTLLSLDFYNIRRENRETARLIRQADIAAEEEVRVQSIRALQSSAGGEIEAFAKSAITEESLVSVIEAIEKAGRVLKLDMEIVSVDKVGDATEGEPQKINITLEADGSWSGVFSLLRAIESLPQRVMFQNVNYSKSGNLWRANVTFALYSFK